MSPTASAGTKSFIPTLVSGWWVPVARVSERLLGLGSTVRANRADYGELFSLVVK